MIIRKNIKELVVGHFNSLIRLPRINLHRKAWTSMRGSWDSPKISKIADLTIPATQIQNPNVKIPNAKIPNPKSQIMISIFCRNPKSQIPNTSNLGFWRPKSQIIWDLGNTYTPDMSSINFLESEFNDKYTISFFTSSRFSDELGIWIRQFCLRPSLAYRLKELVY